MKVHVLLAASAASGSVAWMDLVNPYMDFAIGVLAIVGASLAIALYVKKLREDT